VLLNVNGNRTVLTSDVPDLDLKNVSDPVGSRFKSKTGSGQAYFYHENILFFVQFNMVQVAGLREELFDEISAELPVGGAVAA